MEVVSQVAHDELHATHWLSNKKNPELQLHKGAPFLFAEQVRQLSLSVEHVLH